MTSPQVPDFGVRHFIVRHFISRSALPLVLLAGLGLGVGCSASGSSAGTGGANGSGSGGRGNSGSGGSNGNPGSGGSNGNPGSGGNNGNPGSGGNNNNPGSGGNNSNPGSGGSNGNPGSGGSNGNPGSGGSNGNPGSGGGSNPGSGGSGNPGTGGSLSGGNPPGYWTYAPKMWGGCSWTGIDALAGSTTTNSPKDFLTKPAGDPYCVKGSVHPDVNAVALLGFNLAEPAAGASCAYKVVDVNAPGPPAVTLTGTGLAISFSKNVASNLRVQIQGPNGAKDANDRWCYAITPATGPVFAPFSAFNTKCWDNTGTAYTTAKPISAIVFLVPGTTNSQPFDYCIGGFTTGTSVADAPPYTGGGSLTGMIGGAGDKSIDYARVKVSAGGKSYIIQNNNWGNPSGSDQTLSYKDNSFKVVSSTGSVTGQGVPASFPSIFIGANGDLGAGATATSAPFSTRENDNLPKQLSAIQSVTSTFKYNHAPSGGRNYNATYDIWFSSQIPTSRYDDGISGFVMVWLFKPSGNQPIGSKMATATIAGATYDVWVGPRGGSLANSNAPVVSYVAQNSVTALTNVDLKAFMTDATSHGINSSWYLTDVFGGFEIWNGGDATGLEATEFTAVVK